MIIFLKLVLSILIPTFFGFAVISALSKKTYLDFTFKLALSYGLGLGLISLWMLVLGMLQIQFVFLTIAAPILLATFILFPFSLNNISCHKILLKQTKTTFTSYHFIKRLLLSFLILLILTTVILSFKKSLLIPICKWDEYSTIAYKAKIFYFEKGLPDLKYLPHGSYPLFIPFVHVWTSINLGFWDDQLIKIIFPIFLICSLTINYKFLAKKTNTFWAILGCTLLISSNFLFYHSTISYRDLAMMLFNCTTIILLLLWLEEDDIFYPISASIFAGIATFTKLEGTMYLFVYFCLFLLILTSKKNTSPTNRLKDFLIFLLPALSICLIFHLYKTSLGVAGMSNRLSVVTFHEQFSRIREIIISFVQSLFLSGNWNYIWYVFVFSILFNYKKINKSKECKYILLCIVLFFLMYFLFFLTTATTINYFSTVSRVVLHFFPLSVLVIVLLNYQKSR